MRLAISVAVRKSALNDKNLKNEIETTLRGTASESWGTFEWQESQEWDWNELCAVCFVERYAFFEWQESQEWDWNDY